MKFVPHDDQSFNFGRMLIDGRMVAQGTGGSPVVFTSYYDDSVGGDTDNGGRAPARGDWYTIAFSNSSLMSVLDNTVVRYGGDEAYDTRCSQGAVNVTKHGRLQVTRSKFEHSLNAGIHLDSYGSDGTGSFSVAHSEFGDSGCGVGAQWGTVYNNLFKDSIGGQSLRALSAVNLSVTGNWFHTILWLNSGTRASSDFKANAFVDGVTNEPGQPPTGQDHPDLRFNAWGAPRVLPGTCVGFNGYQNAVPAVEVTVSEDCPSATPILVTRYFTNVIPMWAEPPLMEYGPGATLVPPGGSALPLEQTFGGVCDCFVPPSMQQHLTQRPVNTATGSLVEFFTDLALPGRGVPLNFTRTYNSLDITTGVMGPGWTFGYNASLTPPVGADGPIRVRGEDGKQVVFTKESGAYVAPPGVRSTLAVVSGGYKLTKPDQSYLVFDSSGRLSGMKDHLDRGLSFAYTDGKLTTITDPVGRTVSLTYVDGKLTRAALEDGRDVEYGYTDGRLTSSTDLRGKTTTYGYTAGGLLEWAKDPQNHFLFQNTYDPETLRVTEQLDPRGKKTTFGWDQATQTSTMTDPAGKQWVEIYDGNVLVEMRNPDGDSVTYGYDARLNRTSATDGNNKTTVFTYDDAGNLLTRTAPAPLSDQEVWTYTSFNAVDTYTNARGKVTDYDYNAAQQLTKVTDGLGRQTTFTYTSQGQVDQVTDPRSKVTNHDYDADGNLSQVTSPEGNITKYGYDDYGRLTSEIEPRGNVTGATAADYTNEYGYNAGNQLTTITDALDHTTTYTYDDAGNLDTVTDADGKVTDFDYNEDNQVTKVTDARNGQTITVYDVRGNIASVTTPEGTTTYTYDDANRLATKTTPRGNVAGATAADFTWTYTYDGNGNLKTKSHPTAGTTTYDYDALNRRISVTNAQSKTTTFTYTQTGRLKTATDPLNRVTTYAYDDADQLDTVTDANGKVTDYGYDLSGNQTSILSPGGRHTTSVFDGDGQLTTRVNPRGNVTGATPADYNTVYEYDPAGHLKKVTDPHNRTTNYTYDRVGNLKTVTDGNGHATSYGYDVLDQLKTVTGPANTGTTTYTYDDTGNLKTRVNAKQRTTTYGYDLAGRVTSKATQVGTWTYDYDAEGNLKATTLPSGNKTVQVGDGTVTNTYDPLGRLTGVDYSDSTPDVINTYDELYPKTMADGQGPNETYTFDAAGQLRTVTRGTKVFAYDYDDLGRLISRQQPGGVTLTQTWNDDSLPTTVKNGATTYASYTYDADGNRTHTDLGNDLKEDITYDRAGWVQQMQVLRGTSVVGRHTYTRDNVGNPTEIIRDYGGLTSPTEINTYDPADRLTKTCFNPSCNPRVEYTYDELGNRLTENRVGLTGNGLTTYTYNDKDQLEQTSRPILLNPPAITTYGYDDNGNQTTAGAATFTYDLAGRTTSHTAGGTTTNYTYDGAGKRLTSTTGSTTTNYTWDTSYPLPELVSATTGSNERRFIQDPGGDPLVEIIPGTGLGTGLHYLHTDDLGTVRATTDATNATRATNAFEPFGTERPSPTGQNVADTRTLFAGEYADPATGLYHLRARDYDPTIGRFTALDPIAQDIRDPYVAEYLYVANKPTTHIDPTGLCGSSAAAKAFCGLAFWAEKGKDKIEEPIAEQYNEHSGGVHLTLDLLGLVPVIGEPADVLNGLLYAMEADASNTILCGVAVIPVVGWAAAVIKAGRHADEAAAAARAADEAATAAKSADVIVPDAWNAATKLPSGGTVRDVGNRIWGHGLPSPDRLAGMTDEELRALASLDDAKMLNAMYRGAGPAVPNNATAPIRVDLSQQVIDAWSRK